MSVILAVIGGESAAFDDSTIYRALTSMRASRDDRFAIWRGPGVTLAVARHAWEMSPAFSGDALVVTDGEIAVVADASIYYCDDLRAALARAHVGVTGSSASHLILAAYCAWGADCAARIEGDFAFVVWDARSHTVVAARDFSGKRTLYYSERGGKGSEKGTLVVASTPGGALALPNANTALDLTVIGETALGLWGGGAETCYEGVRVLQGGETLTRVAGAPMRLHRTGGPPPHPCATHNPSRRPQSSCARCSCAP